TLREPVRWRARRALLWRALTVTSVRHRAGPLRTRIAPDVSFCFDSHAVSRCYFRLPNQLPVRARPGEALPASAMPTTHDAFPLSMRGSSWNGDGQDVA